MSLFSAAVRPNLEKKVGRAEDTSFPSSLKGGGVMAMAMMMMMLQHQHPAQVTDPSARTVQLRDPSQI